MKPDLYTKSLLTIAVVLLSVIAASLSTNSVHPVVHAAGPVVYQYRYMQFPYNIHDSGPGLNDVVNTLGEDSQKGWELVTVLPLAGKRNDNIAMGTEGILAIYRRPK
jgi:hypothetical protein